jgi:hypothetical protein
MTDEVKDEDLKLNEQADGSVTVGDEPPKEETTDEGGEDERVAKSDDDHDDEHDEDETDLSVEEKRERNRRRRAESKEKRKEYIDSLKRELSSRDRVINEMNQRLSTVERKSTGSEMAQLDNAEQEAVKAYTYFRDINAKAIEQANGAVAIEAQEKMFEARRRVEQLQGIKQAMTKRQSAPQPLDPRLINHAQSWMGKNQWYDPSGRDEDSAVTLTIDNRLAQEGWDPTTPEYWTELESRIKKFLPHRVKSGYNSTQGSGKRNPPPVSGSGRESSSSGSTSYKLSPDRVQAIKDAGAWDDPGKRAAMVKSFQAYDKERANG